MSQENNCDTSCLCSCPSAFKNKNVLYPSIQNKAFEIYKCKHNLVSSGDRRLGGPTGGGGGVERMDEMHLSALLSILNHAHGKHSKQYLFHDYLILFYFFHARDCTTFTLHDLTEFLSREGDSALH